MSSNVISWPGKGNLVVQCDVKSVHGDSPRILCGVTITIAEPRQEIFLDAPHSQTLAFSSLSACTMNVSRSAVRSSRWSKPIEQFLRESTQTSPRRGFASATRVTDIQNAQQPRQQRLAGQAGGYGRVEQRRAFSYSPISLHGHLDPPKPGEE